jgi:hypothetical protein
MTIPPFIDYKFACAKSVNNTPTLVFVGAAQKSIVDNIFVTNTTNNNLFLDVLVNTETEQEPNVPISLRF